ncbi:MAG: hypothetical protein IK011_06320 [Bacteroidaceae bacterium]|nr:hypothetical protein [Bacteroidaceae bacterium]
MKIARLIALAGSLMLLTACTNYDADWGEMWAAAKTKKASHPLRVVARQPADAFLQYKAEMPLFTLDDIRSFNIDTGEITFGDVVFDSHVFYDVACKYRVFFYDGDELLFDALAVSWFSSVGYFDQLTFQTIACGSDTLEASKSKFYLRYGYPGTIKGDTALEDLMQKNAAGMERFIRMLRQAGKIVVGQSCD